MAHQNNVRGTQSPARPQGIQHGQYGPPNSNLGCSGNRQLQQNQDMPPEAGGKQNTATQQNHSPRTQRKTDK